LGLATYVTYIGDATTDKLDCERLDLWLFTILCIGFQELSPLLKSSSGERSNTMLESHPGSMISRRPMDLAPIAAVRANS
jgi:hypothetical protein